VGLCSVFVYDLGIVCVVSLLFSLALGKSLSSTQFRSSSSQWNVSGSLFEFLVKIAVDETTDLYGLLFL
jgi:hypothetical protein